MEEYLSSIFHSHSNVTIQKNFWYTIQRIITTSTDITSKPFNLIIIFLHTTQGFIMHTVHIINIVQCQQCQLCVTQVSEHLKSPEEEAVIVQKQVT